MRESKTLIFSSSVTRDIKKGEFNTKCKSNVVFNEFRGKKAEDIVHYMDHHLERENPHTVVLVAGGNDLPNKDILMSKINEVANHLIEGGIKCRDQYGVTHILISSVLPRMNGVFQGNRHRVNQVLRKLCMENGFVFIENDDIVLGLHGHHDGVHLNEAGTDLLSRNLCFAVNNVD